jgi:rhodanese-related sulfurtransferase
VGLWNVRGLVAAAPAEWLRSGLELGEGSSWDLATLSQKLAGREALLIDVRERDEWLRGHLDGSLSVPLSRLLDVGIASVGDGPVAVACAGGMRAAFAASVIRRAVDSEVVRVVRGGVGDLPRYGISLTVGE